MWAVDIPCVSHLQFPNVDRHGFQEKLSRREARHWGTKRCQGVPFLPEGAAQGLHVPSIPGRRQLFLAEATPISHPGQEQGRGTPTAVPWPPLDPSRGDLRQLQEALCRAARAWPWAGAGVEVRPPTRARARGSCGCPGRRAGLAVTGPLM